MSDRLRIGLALLAAWGLVLAAIGAAALLVGADLADYERAVLIAVLSERAASLVVVSLLLLAPLVFILNALFRRYVKAPRRLADDIRIMMTANPSHRAAPAGSAEIRRLGEGFNAARRCPRDAEGGRGAARARSQCPHRAGKEPPRGTDVGARAKCGHVQCRGPHPALQRPRDAAPQEAAGGRGSGRQDAQPRRAGPFDIRDLRPQPHHPRAGDHPRAPRPGHAWRRRELRDHGALRPAGPGADGAGVRGGGRCRGRGRSRRHHRVRAGSRQHHAAHRIGQSPRFAAADADAGDACLARQCARGRRDDCGVSRHGQGGAGPVHRHHRRGSAAAHGQTRCDRRRIRRFAAHRMAARRHARRGPDRGGAAPDRKQARSSHQAGSGRRVDLAQCRQLLADAGDHLSREPPARGIRRPRGPLRSRSRGRDSPISTSSGPALRSDPRRRWHGRPTRWNWAARRARSR